MMMVTIKASFKKVIIVYRLLQFRTDTPKLFPPARARLRAAPLGRPTDLLPTKAWPALAEVQDLAEPPFIARRICEVGDELTSTLTHDTRHRPSVNNLITFRSCLRGSPFSAPLETNNTSQVAFDCSFKHHSHPLSGFSKPILVVIELVLRSGKSGRQVDP